MDCKAGVAINPHTPVHFLEDIIEEVDMVNLMSVNPGFGGQRLIENTFKKIRLVKELIADANTAAHIEIDGGVNINNAKDLLEAGADVLVAGSFVFKSNDPVGTIRMIF